MAMIFSKKEVSPVLRDELYMKKNATEGKKGIASQNTPPARQDTSIAVSLDHNDYLDKCATATGKSKREVLAAILQRHINSEATTPEQRIPELRSAAQQYAKAEA